MPLFAYKFKELKNLLASRNEGGLKAFAAQAATQAFEFNDERLAKLAVVAYAFSKLVMKPYIVDTRRWKRFVKLALEKLEQGENCGEDQKTCTEVLGVLLRELDELSRDMGRSVFTAVEKGRVKAATQIYAHGASVGTAVQLTGADRKELLAYMGTTRLPEKYESKNVGQRLAYADKLFK